VTNYILRTEEAKNNCFLELVRASVGEMPPVEVVFRTYRQKRSLQQNALLHKWFDEIAKATGEYSADDIKTLMKAKFSPRKLVCGEMIPTATSKLNSAQMAEFMDQVAAFAGTYGVALTQPDDLRETEGV
tara:strand:- start:968 stop:1357 length:390 start_codon:yes stop_codon:yes gene_type:complete